MPRFRPIPSVPRALQQALALAPLLLATSACVAVPQIARQQTPPPRKPLALPAPRRKMPP